MRFLLPMFTTGLFVLAVTIAFMVMDHWMKAVAFLLALLFFGVCSALSGIAIRA